MAILRGEEARQWLAANPNKAYTNLTTSQQIVRQPGFLEKLGLSISKPFRTALGVGQEFGSTIRDLSNVSRGDWSTFMERPEKYALMSEEETEALQRDPVRSGLKSAAGVLSYTVPGGGGAATSTMGRIGTAAARGAGTGALSGFALSEEDEELGSALRGGALGGLVGGALQGASEGAQALARKKAQVGNITDQEVKNWLGEGQLEKAGGSKRAKEGIATIKSEGSELGLKLSDRLQREEALDPIVKSLDQKADLALASHKPVSKAEITSEIVGKVKNIKNYDNNAAFVEVQNILDGYGNTLSGPEVRSLYKEIADAGSVYAINPTTRASTSRIWKAAREGVRGTLEGQGSDIIKQISSVYSVKDSIMRQAGRDVGMSAAGAIGLNVKPRLLTKVGDRASSAVAGGLPQLPQGGADFMSQLVGVGQRAIPALPALLGQGQPETEQGMGQPGMAPDMYGQMGQPQGPQIDQMALIEAVMSGQMSISEANWLMEMLGGQQVGGEVMPTTESGRKFWFAKKSADNILQMLDQTGPLAGPLQGVRTGLTSAVGIADEQTALKNEIEAMRSIVFNALGGAQLTPNEQRQYEKFIPKVTDTKAQVRQKLKTLIPKLEGLMGASPEPQNTALYEMGLGVNY